MALSAVRNQETNLGDLVTDAYRAVGESDIALVNGGGIRESIASGDITYADIISVHPFGNEICVVNATGQQILDALEMGAHSLPDENGGFLHMSGMTCTIDVSVPSSVKTDENQMFVSVEGEYRVKDVKIGGQPLEPTKTYTVASHNYLLKNGGDGINVFQKDEVIRDGIMLDNQALISYITDDLGGTVPEQYSKQQNRISIQQTAGEKEPFSDVMPSDWYYSGVVYAYENNFFKGTTDTLFSPSETMTRGMLVTVLYRMENASQSTAGEGAARSAFQDVTGDAYYAEAVNWAYENKIVSGIDESHFAPSEKITREQLAAILYRYAKYKNNDVSVGEDTNILSFDDASGISEYAVPALQWAVGAEIVSGADGKLMPKDGATRAQTALMLQRFCS